MFIIVNIILDFTHNFAWNDFPIQMMLLLQLYWIWKQIIFNSFKYNYYFLQAWNITWIKTAVYIYGIASVKFKVYLFLYLLLFLFYFSHGLNFVQMFNKSSKTF